ncbi:conserved Plasmodium protein, unknown function [Plasmodium berghei]|uniref:Clathrin light chain n=2 Tax=Plasmodium berghei TaxID=5821 RepID=A0A509AJ77_PLABA|nr:clathrin light chain, putative [Plasmodium berghei ANKA]CXI50325.1 conserved Plasmodium protein, unknown function [Plasmodium berghei]SCL94236.1 conserved Plasmodium protein, unknown function [Plasmodium berghei]SCM15968.1 conserved Plasmodium protein, unknown function [Plasmodium berghei]SCM17764.1 conserved Plasmodium protein, unknown function [Plasmodium berghei]SCN25980.1 conserved Plasmodium protein, unknown function [Plasmodium berghei]|eukprot:XP_034421893.1 clathrin light chain, putative [Plasmodium berghei ANKA]
MNELNEYDGLNFNEYENMDNNEFDKKNVTGNKSYEFNEDLYIPTSLNDNVMENNVNYDNINIDYSSNYKDLEIDKRENPDMMNNNRYDINKNNDSVSKYATLGKESKISIENSYEQFFENESEISDTEESVTWETERLKRIEERKEYEEKKKKEIKKKAAEDLKKWYEEMAVVIKENKQNSKKISEEKKEENNDNKIWLKVSQYLDLEKGEYFKENSRMKQVLLKLLKEEEAAS